MKLLPTISVSFLLLSVQMTATAGDVYNGPVQAGEAIPVALDR